jgi:hypothetical protein
MLHCNMNAATSLLLDLEDLLADLRHARRTGDLGRLALLSYCEVRRWARKAGHDELAARTAAMVTAGPHGSRQAFLDEIDGLIASLQSMLADATVADAAAPRRCAPATPPAPH